MLGVLNVTDAVKVENKQGLILYIKHAKGYVCDNCQTFFRGNCKDISGEECFCYNCAVSLGKRQPKKQNRDIVKEYAEEHKLTIEQAIVLLGITEKQKRTYSCETKERQARRMSLVRRRMEDKKIFMKEAIAQLKAEGIY